MNQHVNYFFLFLALSLAAGVWLSGCTETNDSTSQFDRTALLENMADNLIIPAYTELSVDVAMLQNAATAFTQNPTLTSLATLQDAWKKTYITWQYANAYNFGPGGEEGLRKGLIEEIGTFPISESKINTIVSSGTYNLSDFNRDARGFLAVEFLIFNLSDNNQAVVDDFTSTIRKQYLNDLITNIKFRVNEVTIAWSGSYKTAFIGSNGTDVGSSTSQLYNEFVRSFEFIKNFKIGLPLGKQPGQTHTEPDLIEAYYSGISVKLFKAHVSAIENIWYGRKKDGTDGIGFEEYLQNVTGGPALLIATKTQLEQVKSAMNAIPETPRFADQLDSSPTPIEIFHAELQKHTRYFKSDMSSLLGLAITSSSSDGD